MCKVRDIAVPHIMTTISFICDFEAMVTSFVKIQSSSRLFYDKAMLHILQDTIPEYIGGREECHYQILWKTAAACSIESLRNRSAITAGKCTVNNPLTNFT